MSALSFANIQDLNITNASLSKEELTAVLDNANVTRLFLDGIESLDLDMVKTYLARNNKITCFSAARCPLPEIEVIQALYQIRHESLQVVYLPSYRRLLFSGAIGWHVNVLPHKHSSGSRVEIKLVPDGPHDAACQLLLILVVNTVGGAVGGTAKQREDEIMMSFQETVTTRSITFQAVANGDRFIVGAIVNNHQQTVSFGGKFCSWKNLVKNHFGKNLPKYRNLRQNWILLDECDQLHLLWLAGTLLKYVQSNGSKFWFSPRSCPRLRTMARWKFPRKATFHSLCRSWLHSCSNERQRCKIAYVF